MTGGALIVCFIMLVAVGGVAALIYVGYRRLTRWWSQPVEPPPPELPPPSEVGPECLVYLFADLFMDMEMSEEASDSSQGLSTLIPSTQTYVATRPLVEEMLFATFATLVSNKAIACQSQPKATDSFSAYGLRDWELKLNKQTTFPLTPLARNLEAGWNKAVNSWFRKRSPDEWLVLEDTIEHALRETRRCLGRWQCRGNACEDLIHYVNVFLAQQGLLTFPDSKPSWWNLGKRQFPTPVRERIESLRSQAISLKDELSRFRVQHPTLSEQIQKSISDALAAIKQLEPSREGWM